MHRVFDRPHQCGFTLNERSRGWDESVALTEYQPLWPVRFAIEARVLREALHPLQPEIAHVGSTAVPGLAARPIIDIALSLPRPTRITAFVERLHNFGYLPIEAGPCSSPTFVRRERGVRTHQVMLVDAGGAAWYTLLALRDRLRSEPDMAIEYARLKRPLATHPAIALPAYRQAKAAFARRVLQTDVERPAA